LASALVGAAWLCEGRCHHEDGANHTVLEEGRPVMESVSVNTSKLYFYENSNVTTMNQPEKYRKLIFTLEPCEGVVYLLVRRTRPCWPNVHSCCQPLSGATGGATSAPPCNLATHSIRCGWTHFHSVIDGTRDGAPTFFEVPFGSTKHYLTVFAPPEANLNRGVSRPKFRLTVLADVGAFPRPGRRGQLRAKLGSERSIEVAWDPATFIPLGVSDIRNYHLFSSLLLQQDQAQNEAVFVSPEKVMNSACGLERNAVRYGLPIGPAGCREGECRAIISGVVPRRRYMLNIVAESHRGFNASYSGIIVSSEWSEGRHAFSDWSERTTSFIGAVCGTTFGVLVMGYLWIVKLYK